MGEQGGQPSAETGTGITGGCAPAVIAHEHHWGVCPSRYRDPSKHAYHAGTTRGLPVGATKEGAAPDEHQAQGVPCQQYSRGRHPKAATATAQMGVCPKGGSGEAGNRKGGGTAPPPTRRADKRVGGTIALAAAKGALPP